MFPEEMAKLKAVLNPVTGILLIMVLCDFEIASSFLKILYE